MKASTFLLSLAMVLVLISCRQGPDQSTSDNMFDSATDDVSLIQREIIRINGITSEIRIFKFSCEEEIEVTYYLDKGKAVKIVIDWPVIDGRDHQEEYYFKDGKLIFDYDYAEGGEHCADCLPALEMKTYISGDKPIQHLRNDSLADCSDCHYDETHPAYQLYPARSRQELREILCPGS